MSLLRLPLLFLDIGLVCDDCVLHSPERGILTVHYLRHVPLHVRLIFLLFLLGLLRLPNPSQTSETSTSRPLIRLRVLEPVQFHSLLRAPAHQLLDPYCLFHRLFLLFLT